MFGPGSRPDRAPTVFLDPQATLGVGVGLDDLRAVIDIRVADDDPVTISADMAAKLFTKIGVDGQRSTIMAEPTQLDANAVNITMPDRAFLIGTTGVDSFVRNQMLPLLTTSTAGLALTSSLFPLSLFAVRLENAVVTHHSIRADLDVWPAEPNDANAPVTKLLGTPRRRIPSHIDLDMLSFDDKTPTQFLRHQIYVDGTPRPLSIAGRRITVHGLTPGEHVIQLAAVDLNDNEDPSGVFFNVNVDAAAPLVLYRKKAMGVVTGDFVELQYEARDNETPDEELSYSYRVTKIGATPQDDVLLGSGTPITPGRLVLHNLPEDSVIVARIEATDEVGNVGYAETTFGVNRHPTLGCTAGRPVFFEFVSILGLLWITKRRRHP